ncbi:hypothetical protein BVZ63_1594 [Haemophilus influenzae]|nr:hypothetical protein BVZ63_1594 [Haemophilus influenzae]
MKILQILIPNQLSNQQGLSSERLYFSLMIFFFSVFRYNRSTKINLKIYRTL